MPLIRMLVTYKDLPSTENQDAMTNTLYFNVTTGPIDPVGYQDLVDDLYAIYASRLWLVGRWLNVRAYDMDEAPTPGNPREIKAQKTGEVSGTRTQGPHQLCLALSYYADRNLAGRRGRIYCGPFLPAQTNGHFATVDQQNHVLDLADDFANLGGVNVDWSLYSEKTGEHTRINHAWVDNSWDIQRRRKLRGTSRVSWSGNG